MNILFRCDGSVKLGMGHVVRCLALADHLKENYDCNIKFAMRKSELGIKKIKETYPVLESNEKGFSYKEWLTDCIEKTKANVLIMDMRDGLTREELTTIKKKIRIEVVTIDDPEDKRLEAELAFYPSVPQLEKLNWTKFEGKLYVGWEYVILRKEFSISYSKNKNPVPKILISMGATDEKNMTCFVLNALNEIKEKFIAIIIVGIGYPHIKELENKLNSVNFQFKLHKNPDKIAKVMSQTDFAVISFGQTAYELAALKVPAIYLCLTDDHFESSKLFMNEGIGTSLGIYSHVKQEYLVGTILFHIIEKNKVKEMSDRAGLLNCSNLNRISSLIQG